MAGPPVPAHPPPLGCGIFDLVPAPRDAAFCVSGPFKDGLPQRTLARAGSRARTGKTLHDSQSHKAIMEL